MDNSNRALIIVDVQPTFTEGGALGVEGGNAVADKIADFVTENASEYNLIVTTQDWHVDPGTHFSDNPDFVDTWPPHGVAGTAEAELHDAIAALPIDDSVKKGEYAAAYSGFEGKNKDEKSLEMILREGETTAVDVVGIAESHCVKETALDALRAGWPVRVFSDLTVPTSEELGAAARAEMDEAGVEQLDSAEAFGFYEEDDSELPWDDEFDDDLDADGSWDDGDYDGDGIPDDLEDDEQGAGDYRDDEFPPTFGDTGAFAREPERDEYDDESSAELDSGLLVDGVGAGGRTGGAGSDDDVEDLSDLDLSEFDIDIDDLDGVDFSDDADEGDFDFSDIDFKPGR